VTRAKVVAPGKVLLTGAYAVLEGAPALVLAVDRLAVADGAVVDPAPAAEIRAAFDQGGAPRVDVRALYEGGAKLGLGSSAAALVAALGVRAHAHGRDLADPDVRAALLREARRAHASVQGGGSGVDIAASVFGGALAYRVRSGEDAEVTSVRLPGALCFRVFWTGTPVRTSSMRARIDALTSRDPASYRRAIDALSGASSSALQSAEASDLRGFVRAAQARARALAARGRAPDAPTIPAGCRPLLGLAEAENAAFYPSGAGGGDVCVYLGEVSPSDRLLQEAAAAGMRPLELSLDPFGVRVAPGEAPAVSTSR
jgi:phosphomevalonate kinase